MKRLYESLENQILPAVSEGNVRVLPYDAAPATVDTAFIEAYPYDSHRHSYFEWMWLLSGEAHLKIEDHIYTVAAGDLCFLPPLMRHADVYNAATPAYQSLWFAYHADAVSAHLFRYEPYARWTAETYCMADCAAEARVLLLALQNEMESSALYTQPLRQALLVQLTVMLLRTLEPLTHSPIRKALPGHVSRRVMRYLAEHYAEKVSLNDVARAAFLSPNYLASVFRQESGQTVFDALTQIRMDHARRLLLEGQLPVYAVADAVGYGDVHHFSRAFRKHTGIPPSRYGK